MFCPVCRADYPAEWKVCPKDATALLRSPQIGKYTIEGLIGIGGMGAVYRAVNPDTRSEVAIKIMNPNVAGATEARQRFQREAAAVAKLKTSHVVKVNDFGTEADGTLYLVMELLDGHTLRDEILAPPELMDLARVQFVMDGSLKGLAAAHKIGIVHRDLKPENIFVAQTDDGEVPKLLDFGIARVETTGPELTRTGTMMGTASYMAPEQVSGNVPEIGPWTDVYAMGAILYELLTGTLAFGGSSITEVLAKVLQSEVAPLRTVRPGLPDAIYDVVHACLKGDRASRPQNAEELRQVLIAARLVPLGTTIPKARSKPEVAGGIAPTIGVTGATANARVARKTPDTAGAASAASVRSESAVAPPAAPVEDAPPRSRRRLMLGGVAVIAIGVVAFVALRSDHKSASAPVGDARPSDQVARVADVDAGARPADAEVAVRHDDEPDPLATFPVPVEGDIAVGAADAKVTLVVAGEDYACPACEHMRAPLAELRKKYGPDLRIVYKAFVAHPGARAAAVATCAAAKQGKYSELSDLLWTRSYAGYAAAKSGDLAGFFDADNCWAAKASSCSIANGLAKEAGVNLAKFAHDFVGCIDAVARDQQQLVDLGVTGIPTFYVNGRYVSGPKEVTAFVPIIDEELHKADDRIAHGTTRADYYRHWVVDGGVAKPAGSPIAAAKPRPKAKVPLLKITATTPRPTPGETTPPLPLAEACDQVSCANKNFEGACCAKLKPAALPDHLDRSMLEAGIAPLRAAIAQCGDSGTVTVSVVVGPEGHVSTVWVTETTLSVSAGYCVVNKISSAKFARAKNSTSFTSEFSL